MLMKMIEEWVVLRASVCWVNANSVASWATHWINKGPNSVRRIIETHRIQQIFLRSSHGRLDTALIQKQRELGWFRAWRSRLGRAVAAFRWGGYGHIGSLVGEKARNTLLECHGWRGICINVVLVWALTSRKDALCLYIVHLVNC